MPDARRPLGRGGLQVGPHAFGSAPIGNSGSAVSDADAAGALAAAWECGVRYLDTAPHYGLGLAERRIGAALSDLPRDELIVSTKVGRLLEPSPAGGRDTEGFDVPATHVRMRDYSRDGVLRSLESSLARLGLDRVDLLLVHDPDEHYREALDSAFPALEELRAQRVIRAYGAGMNQSEMLADFVRHTDLDVLLLAGRYTLLEQGALDELLPLCVAREVSVIAGGVFNSGLLATDEPDPGSTYDYGPVPAELLAKARSLAAVCRRHDTTLPAAAVHFALRHPAVATVCLGSRTAAEVRRNAGLFAAAPPDELWAELAATGLIREEP